MLLKYYRPLRDQFFTQIATAESYPVIDWIDFTNSCQTWNIIDSNLKMADIDRIFIATNVELEEQEGNDDRSLCRFEFYEIITRMAKTKYFESNMSRSIADSIERLLLEYILPLGEQKMDGMEWRKTFLWHLEVDDLLKANMDSLKKLFALLKSKGGRYIELKKLHEYVSTLPLQVSLDTVTMAFAFSKMQVVEELEKIELYEQLFFVEFLEFLGRLAYLIWDSHDEALDAKLWRIM